MFKKSKWFVSIVLNLTLLLASLPSAVFSIGIEIDTLPEKDKPAAIPREIIDENRHIKRLYEKENDRDIFEIKCQASPNRLA